MNSRLYVGSVMHARLSPVAHAFRYPAFAFVLDIDELAALDSALLLFGHNRRGLFSLHEGDYLGSAEGSLRDRLRRHVDATGSDIELDRVELVTTPRFAGHTFNPVSFYYCYGSDAALRGIVVEVNNTFGEAHVYVLPVSAGDLHGDTLAFTERKRFHVSPFNDMEGAYEFHFRPLAESLDIRIGIRRGEDRSFTSRLSGDVRPLDNASLARLAATYPLTSALVLPRILWHAYKLHYRKGLPVVPKPEPSSARTFVASRPSYLSELSTRGWLRANRHAPTTRGNHGSR
jgi:cyclopropane-fatty-acyl-phospholipid synthase